jgi:Dyp-type peroxidase family
LTGCPIQKSPDDDVPKLAFENDFKFARGDAKNCPFAAHIRKSHIRQGLNSSRIMRRGIPYGGDFVDGGPDKDRGLLFACYQSTIERGYGFIQKAWANKADFPEIGKSGFDVTIGQSKDTKANQFFVANGSRSTPINPANDFVTTKGGEYFFVPSINLLKNGFDLSQLPKPKVGQPELKA